MAHGTMIVGLIGFVVGYLCGTSRPTITEKDLTEQSINKSSAVNPPARRRKV